MMNEDLRQAVRAAVAELAESELIELVAEAAVSAVIEVGYFPGAGWEYALRQGDRLVEGGFNTQGQAQAWADENLGKVAYLVQRRRVGVWENVPLVP
ncbi:hypothetical protein [Arthrobacter sp. SD76]|uniref:hypothetical protein n=1 Tax=Arthrobacter sp. SD76 TaxID=3415007 RepID=UPI003C78BFDB